MRRKVSLLRVASKGPMRIFRLCCTDVVLVSLVCFQVAGCTPMQLAQYQARDLGTYNHLKSNNGLQVVVHPITDKDEQDKYFGTHLTDKGVLAVYVRAENHNPMNSFVLSGDKIALVNLSSKESLEKANKEDAADPAVGRTLAQVSVIAIWFSALILVPLAAVAAGVGSQMAVNAAMVQYGVASSELFTRTVSPGKSVDGFVFFKIPDKKINPNEFLLSVQAIELGASATHNFEFAL